MNKKLAIIYFGADLLLIAVCATFGAIYVLNSQVALICSTLIVFASFYAYKKRVLKKQASIDINEVNEIFDDEFSENSKNSENSAQFSENSKNSENSNPADNEAKNLKNLKKNLKKAKVPFKFYDIISAFSPLRITAYLVLILAFFMLLRRGLFEPISFLAGLAIMPIISLFASILIKE